MLPDFPEQKARLEQILLARIEDNVKRQTLGLPGFVPHEGDKVDTQHVDGTIEDSPSQEIRSSINKRTQREKGMSLSEAQRLSDEVAQGLAGQIMGHVFSVLSEATSRAGTAIDAKGSPFTFELFLDVLGRMDWDFDGSGNWNPPVLVMHPQMYSAVRDDVVQWKRNPDHIRRFRALLERKREEWRERESRRKLVD